MNTPRAISDTDDYFYRMLAPRALELSRAYHDEESAVLEKILKKNARVKDMNFIAVGGGMLWELRRAMKYAKRYVCIEPLSDMYLNDSIKYLLEQSDDISFLPKRFDEISKQDLPGGNSFYLFLFNVLAYVDDPLAAIRAVTQPGDIVFVSTWADTSLARAIRQRYFTYINGSEQLLSDISFETLPTFQKVERITGAVTDITVAYL